MTRGRSCRLLGGRRGGALARDWNVSHSSMIDQGLWRPAMLYPASDLAAQKPLAPTPHDFRKSRFILDTQGGISHSQNLKEGSHITHMTLPLNTTRRRFLAQVLIVAGAITVPSFGFGQTRRMERREDRREDGADRMQQRADQMAERSDDPVGIRGAERREDRGDLRQDRRGDRRERVY